MSDDHLTIAFDPSVTPEQQDVVIKALEDLFKAVGGTSGLMVNETQVGSLVRHRHHSGVFRVVSVDGFNLLLDALDGSIPGLAARVFDTTKLSALEHLANAAEDGRHDH